MAAEPTVKQGDPSAQQLAFRFVSGHLALDFAATFGDRHRTGVERLRQPADLDRWLRAAGMPTSTPATIEGLRDGRRLRDVIYRLSHASLGREPIDDTDIAELNDWARRSQLAPQLDRELHCRWVAQDPFKGALVLIACEAVKLLTGPERNLIRECSAAPACSLLYLDRSRGRRRRWCEMGRCGSRAKMSGYRQRQAGRSNSDPAEPEAA